jgi:hypothetical protein
LRLNVGVSLLNAYAVARLQKVLGVLEPAWIVKTQAAFEGCPSSPPASKRTWSPMAGYAGRNHLNLSASRFKSFLDGLLVIILSKFHNSTCRILQYRLFLIFRLYTPS